MIHVYELCTNQLIYEMHTAGDDDDEELRNAAKHMNTRTNTNNWISTFISVNIYIATAIHTTNKCITSTLHVKNTIMHAVRSIHSVGWLAFVHSEQHMERE